MNLSALRHRGFRLYFLGAMSGVNALWIQRVTIGWIAWSLTGSPAFVGLVAALMLAPTFFSGPIFGVLVDRGNVVRAAYMTNGAMLACNLALFLSWNMGLLGPSLLTALAVAIGLAASGNHPVRMSLAPRLVPVELVPSVVALAALNFNLARTIAPAIAGWIIGALGVGWALGVAVILYVPMLLVLRLLHPREMPPAEEGEGFARSLIRGVQHSLSTPVIRTAMAFTGVFALSARSFLEILPVIADGVFARGPEGLGALSAAAGAGALAAAIMKATGRPDAHGAIPPRAALLGLLGVASVAVVGSTTNWPVALGAVAVAGFTGTYIGVTMQAVIQTGLEDRMRGRVMSLWVVVGLGAGSVGALALGAVAEIAGPGLALNAVAAAGAMLLTALWLLG